MEAMSAEVVNHSKERKNPLLDRYTYQNRYFDNVVDLKEKILNKTIIPHQVELQPGPKAHSLICWLECPYCYGKASVNSAERLSPERYKEIISQIAKGGVEKIIFAGYATDPLNSPIIDDLVETALNNNLIIGFNTKAINISPRLLYLLTQQRARPKSYFSISIDAGSNEMYNQVHGRNINANLYDKVLKNIRALTDLRNSTKGNLDVSTTYLINNLNCSAQEVQKAIRDYRCAGTDLIRFSFPQVPRGFSIEDVDRKIPSRDKIAEIMSQLSAVIEGENSDECPTILIDADSEYHIHDRPRTLPCFARFIYPTVGFDGWLSHCSQSSGPTFREMALGNLKEIDFWEVFYGYNVEDFAGELQESANKMLRLGCRCDRKEHIVNTSIQENMVLEGDSFSLRLIQTD